MLNHIKQTDNHWTIILDGKPLKFDASHANYIGLVGCGKAGDAKEFVNLLDTGGFIENWSDGGFVFKDGYLEFEGEQVDSEPTQRVIDSIKGGFSPAPVLNYLRNIYDNVSARAIREGYRWASHKGIAISETGMLVGYKGVQRVSDQYVGTIDNMGNTLAEGDLVDRYTGRSFRNNIGDKPSMKRRQVCDDHTQGCSAGLHVGTYEYACGWAGEGGDVVLVTFNPKDIVSVPSDCLFQKMRVSDYEVLQVCEREIEEAVYECEDVESHVDDACDYCGEPESWCDGDCTLDQWDDE